jgi:hypothetical protein
MAKKLYKEYYKFFAFNILKQTIGIHPIIDELRTKNATVIAKVIRAIFLSKIRYKPLYYLY